MRDYRTISARVIFLCALALLLAACSSWAPTRRDIAAPAPTQRTAQSTAGQPATYLRPGVWRVGSVRAILTSAFPMNHIPPFDQTSTSALRAQQLYNALLALPPMPSGFMSCPISWGNMYHLTFYSPDAQTVATALVEPDGCEVVTPPVGGQRWAATTQGFWSTFAAAMNTSVPVVRNPSPQESGPSAPTSLPN